ncbi:hypothetical protein B1K54_02080 [Streptomyces sp. fd1-xmd]|nr:hypothetical protein B1K54_02080 [Streptomyces sp. fd1-xmd]
MPDEGVLEPDPDRLGDPWGRRTPYGRGEPWQVRVDSYLEESTSRRVRVLTSRRLTSSSPTQAAQAACLQNSGGGVSPLR